VSPGRDNESVGSFFFPSLLFLKGKEETKQRGKKKERGEKYVVALQTGPFQDLRMTKEPESRAEEAKSGADLSSSERS
jgi:hypothetical protein